MDQEVGGIIAEYFKISWILALILMVALYVVITIGPVFTSKQDIRQAEAVILSEKIMGCISENGVIDSNFKIDCINENGYYINASLKSLDSSFAKEEIIGNPVLGVNCQLSGMKKYPSCLNSTYYVLINNSGKIEKGKMELKIGVEKYAENIN